MTFLCRRLLPAVFMLTFVSSAAAQSAGPAAPHTQPKQGQPGGSAPQGAATSPRQARGPELWWRERSPISKELGLTKEQTDRIEKLFQETRPEFNRIDEKLRRGESMLSDMIKDDYSEATIAQQIDKVEGTRSALNKTRQMMLVHMRQVLTPPQRVKFETLHAQFQEELAQADLERQKQERARKQNQNSNPKPDPRSTPDRSGRPGI